MKKILISLVIDFLFLASSSLLIYYTTPEGYLFSTIKKIYIFCVVIFPLFLILKYLFSHFFLKKKNIYRLIIAIVIVFVGIYATFIEPYMLFVKRIEIKSNKIKNQIKILHVSDIQSIQIGSYEERVFKTIIAEEPDIVCHTGDYLQNLRGASLISNIRKLATLINSLPDITYQFAIGGSTDYRYKLNDIFNGKNIYPLVDTSAIIQINKTNINVIGLSEKSIFSQITPKILQEKLSEETYNILLGHQPDLIFHLSEKTKIDLCLAGHTHGGQVNIPFFGPIIIMSGVPRKYAKGFHKIKEKTYLNVTNGVGVEHLNNVMPIRFFCPPDITVITLIPE